MLVNEYFRVLPQVFVLIRFRQSNKYICRAYNKHLISEGRTRDYYQSRTSSITKKWCQPDYKNDGALNIKGVGTKSGLPYDFPKKATIQP